MSERMLAEWQRETRLKMKPSRDNAKRLVDLFGVGPRQSIAVEYHNGVSVQSREADNINGQLIVGGCLTTPGMIRRALSLPYTYTPVGSPQTGELMATLADGAEVFQGDQVRGCFQFVLASGEKYPSVMSAAMALTPAEWERVCEEADE